MHWIYFLFYWSSIFIPSVSYSLHLNTFSNIEESTNSVNLLYIAVKSTPSFSCPSSNFFLRGNLDLVWPIKKASLNSYPDSKMYFTLSFLIAFFVIPFSEPKCYAGDIFFFNYGNRVDHGQIHIYQVLCCLGLNFAFVNSYCSNK